MATALRGYGFDYARVALIRATDPPGWQREAAKMAEHDRIEYDLSQPPVSRGPGFDITKRGTKRLTEGLIVRDLGAKSAGAFFILLMGTVGLIAAIGGFSMLPRKDWPAALIAAIISPPMLLLGIAMATHVREARVDARGDRCTVIKRRWLFREYYRAECNELSWIDAECVVFLRINVTGGKTLTPSWRGRGLLLKADDEWFVLATNKRGQRLEPAKTALSAALGITAWQSAHVEWVGEI